MVLNYHGAVVHGVSGPNIIAFGKYSPVLVDKQTNNPASR